MAPLSITLQQQFEHQREQEWRRAGVIDADIFASRGSGMNAADIGVFRDASRAGPIIVLRCPKAAARPWHGVFAPKPMAEKEPTTDSGVLVKRGRAVVSDYDLMGVWQRAGTAWERVRVTAENGADRGRWPVVAQMLVVALNKRLVSRIQHGCNDDWNSKDNRGVKEGDRFMGFVEGRVVALESPAQAAAFYATWKLGWPYGADGRYRGAEFS